MFLKRILGFLAVFGALSGCSSGTSAPPAPIAEIPSLLQFPEEIGTDVGKINSGGDSSGLQVSKRKNAVGSGLYSLLITAGADIAEASYDLFASNMELFSEFEIPSDTGTTTFSGSATVTIPDLLGGGSLEADIKIDFADFDFDDDGSDEGCSGHTATLPVCLRIWLNDERFIAMVLDEFVTDSSEGKGRARVDQGLVTEGTEGDLSLGAVWDHTDSENISSSLFARGDGTEILDEAGTDFGAHIDLLQEGPAATAKKSIQMAVKPSEAGSETFQYGAQYFEDEDFWLGNVDCGIDECGANKGDTFEDVCAQISTGDSASASQCNDLGLEDLDFPDFATSQDTKLPDDFPATPTF